MVILQVAPITYLLIYLAQVTVFLLKNFVDLTLQKLGFFNLDIFLNGYGDLSPPRALRAFFDEWVWRWHRRHEKLPQSHFMYGEKHNRQKTAPMENTSRVLESVHKRFRYDVILTFIITAITSLAFIPTVINIFSPSVYLVPGEMYASKTQYMSFMTTAGLVVNRTIEQEAWLERWDRYYDSNYIADGLSTAQAVGLCNPVINSRTLVDSWRHVDLNGTYSYRNDLGEVVYNNQYTGLSATVETAFTTKGVATRCLVLMLGDNGGQAFAPLVLPMLTTQSAIFSLLNHATSQNGGSLETSTVGRWYDHLYMRDTSVWVSNNITHSPEFNQILTTYYIYNNAGLTEAQGVVAIESINNTNAIVYYGGPIFSTDESVPLAEFAISTESRQFYQGDFYATCQDSCAKAYLYMANIDFRVIDEPLHYNNAIVGLRDRTVWVDLSGEKGTKRHFVPGDSVDKLQIMYKADYVIVACIILTAVLIFMMFCSLPISEMVFRTYLSRYGPYSFGYPLDVVRKINGQQSLVTLKDQG
ncbi:hypothetical protein V1505DRAFT_358186 [Lipomyces doorenjongii]